jgi:hypothetical protein
MPFKCNLLQKQYNSEMTQMWDNIRDFIVYHYITPRKDTKFWIESTKQERFSPRLKNMLEMWKHRMPREVDYINDKGNNFYSIGNVLWYQIAIGMNLLNPKIAKQELQDYNLFDLTKSHYQKVTKTVNEYIPKCIKTNEYYKSL